MRAPDDDAYWSLPVESLLARLQADPGGLTEQEAAARLAASGPNIVAADSRTSALRVLGRQFRSPLVLVLIVASAIAGLVRDWTGTAIILLVVTASAAIGFLQEYRASRSLDALRSRLAITCRVHRGGMTRTCPTRDVVVGDIVELSAGSLVPADGVLLAARDCFVIQSVLTGESAPVEKSAGVAPADAPMAGRTNTVFMGTSLRSGTATLLVVKTGRHTAFGEVAARLRLQRPETDFERGVRRFSTLLTEFVLVLTLVVMAINLLLDRPALDSLLFAVALAVGITPELLPAIVGITLSHGARALARHGVLVRRLAAIENLGSMTVLCADKTGTLTVGAARLKAALDADGRESGRVLDLAVTNARLQTGLANPLDDVLMGATGTAAATTVATAHSLVSPAAAKVDECPYDFVRKRMSVAVPGATAGTFLTITKGAVAQVLGICATVRLASGVVALDQAHCKAILAEVERHAGDGARVLAVASRETTTPVATELAMVFEGLLLFEDPTKPDVPRTLHDLARLGVQVKIVTGDSRHTARHVAEAVSVASPALLTGDELRHMTDEALWHRAPLVDVFAEVDPNQKERIIRALRRAGHVVGYIGDGINDAPALHAADVGISVDRAVDVAKEAADIVLLKHDLRSIARGIRQGRATFANTQKYILTTTSANFGNMLSMAAVSAFLPFLPLLAPQILLNNLLTDIPSLALAGDRVDAESVERPPRWSTSRIRRFTIVFGGVSSVFDLLTFAALMWLVGASAERFRSGWFLESLATEVLVLLALRTRRPLFASAPGRALLLSSIAVLVAAVLFVQLPTGMGLGLPPLSPALLATLAGITIAYLASVELIKTRLFRTTASGAGGTRGRPAQERSEEPA